MLIGLIFIIVSGLVLAEWRRAASNEAAQRERGGIEPPGDIYAVMRVAYPAAFLTMMAEGLSRGMQVPGWVLAAGIMLFIAAKALKWWVIRTLGPFWTFRVIVVPGTSLVVSGPYRFMRHPNYLAVIGELIAVALMTGAPVSGSIAAVLFCLLILRRIAVEERALDAILPRN